MKTFTDIETVYNITNKDNDILLSHWVGRHQVYELLRHCEAHNAQFGPYKVIHKVGEKLCHG